MVLRALLLGFTALILLHSVSATAQVRIVQWTDAHSTVETISQQLLRIDQAGQEFLAKHPKGEFIVYIGGDFTSIRAQNGSEGGWLSIEAIKHLRQKGYTVLFVPGNHDAFDWTGKINGAKLALRQMRAMKRWGAKILATNLRGRTEAFRPLISASYPLKTIEGSVEFIGMTIPALMTKSNLSKNRASRLFQKVETFNQTYKRLLPQLEQRGVESIILGIHSGHTKMSTQIGVINEFVRQNELSLRIPLILAAHDHQVASFRHRGTHISDAGSHGSFNIIDIDPKGKIQYSQIEHVAMNAEKAAEVSLERFEYGKVSVNLFSAEQALKTSWLSDYQIKIQQHIQGTSKELNRPVTRLQYGVREHKYHLKAGPALLGQMLSEALAQWAQQAIPEQAVRPIVAMSNSSSYRLDHTIPRGEVSELQIRQMYPFLNRAALYSVDGTTLQLLYQSLRSFYSTSNEKLFSPHVNFGVREQNNQLEIKQGGRWTLIDGNQKYWLALDGWLAEHRVGESYKIPEWLEVLHNAREPHLIRSYQDILVEFLPEIIKKNEIRYVTHSCKQLFAL